MAIVRDIDRGFRALVRNFRRLGSGPNVTVGIQGSDALESRGLGQTNASLGAIHEFGTKDGSIPSRPFLRGTADREQTKINRLLEKAARDSARDGNVDQHLRVVGEVIVSDVKRTITQSIGLAPNAPGTIAGKGSSKPLIDTGVLLGSITSVVNRS